MKDDWLVTRFNSELPEVTRRFDAKYSPDTLEISEKSGSVFRLLIKADEGGVGGVAGFCLPLLSNAVQSVIGSYELIRNGYFIQPPVLLRNPVESVCVTLHLVKNPRDLGKIRAGAIEASSTIKLASEIVPFIGRMYGQFSGNFSHVSDLHQYATPFLAHDDRYENVVSGAIMFVRSVLVLIDVVSEGLLFELVDQPQYWLRTGDDLDFNYSPEVADRIEKFSRGSWTGPAVT